MDVEHLANRESDKTKLTSMEYRSQFVVYYLFFITIEAFCAVPHNSEQSTSLSALDFSYIIYAI